MACWRLPKGCDLFTLIFVTIKKMQESLEIDGMLITLDIGDGAIICPIRKRMQEIRFVAHAAIPQKVF